jgi:kinesin family protein C1
MIGGKDETSTGMIPRSVAQIFMAAEKLRSRGWDFEIEASFLEIYNESVRDLLGSQSKPLKHDIKHDSRGHTTVTNLKTVKVSNPQQVHDLIARADANRACGKTNMNERSSRSHSVFTMHLRGSNLSTQQTNVGTLNLIDLAGSERLAQSQAVGDRLKETQAINKSLSALGDVISALSRGSDGHIPYRNSKLTYLLQNSLGGDSKTLMFANVSPAMASAGETVCTMRFATKVNSCVNVASQH